MVGDGGGDLVLYHLLHQLPFLVEDRQVELAVDGRLGNEEDILGARCWRAIGD